ncbi:MAG: ribosome assembly factor SBDS [Candidatus Marsarchaeota archaeon]|nr:ribosome assembly factor SBDS [Candidatus Marsarchaeota archaeon]MCL5413501.1 ribosome assembly factor SBDS [Candidatus Marsarchaeota archaeon]
MPKTVIARYSAGGEHFEIFVDADLAYNFITGKNPNPMLPLQAEEVFVDANKGERAGQEKLRKAFGTTDIVKIAETIMKHGDVPITTEQRRKLLEEKRKQVVEIIATNSVDPKSGAPHPMQRIENAMETAKVQIEPFKSAKEQVDSVVKKINMILPIKFATARLEVIIPAEYANRCYGLLKQYGLKSEEWQSNGSLKAMLEFPAGLQGEFFDKLNGFTKGGAITRSV